MLADKLWGEHAKFRYLFFATLIVIFAFLGSHDIWTQEHRWADIVTGMFYRQDFLHPYLNEVMYYDKPLLSYWLIAAFSFFLGEASTWAMRLPSALAGLLAIWSIYQIGLHLKDKRLGLLAGWMLLTSYFFVFWARTSSADMLNLGGILFAIAWYFSKKNQPSFMNYAVFFLIIALTSLCKGIVGAVVVVLALLPDLLMNNEWKKHLRWSFFLAMIPAAVIYVIPFIASTYVGGEAYEQSGLYLVYRENIMRYFQPFDHKDPIYTYFVYLPIYMLPWAVFFIPALFSLRSQWRNLSSNSKWMILSTLVLFLFFTLSGSRRSYYVLPIVPFAILMTADWILREKSALHQKWNVWAGRCAVIFLIILTLNFAVLRPAYYSQGGLPAFAERMRAVPVKQYVMLDAESKVRFYLHLAPDVKNYNVIGSRKTQDEKSLLRAWPFLTNKPVDVIYVTRKQYAPLLTSYFKNYEIVEAPPTLGERILNINNLDAPVAYIPR